MISTAQRQSARQMRWALRPLGMALAGAVALGAAWPASAQDGNSADDIRIRQLESQVQTLQRQQSTAPAAAPAIGTPATSAMTDMLSRMDALEAQVARLTAEYEELNNRVREAEARVAAAPAPAPAPVAAAPAPLVPTPQPAPQPVATGPSAARLAAVQAVVKPRSNDAAEDEYSYGYKLWQAHFYPEAEQQLQFFLSKYPASPRGTYARNLIGRSYLDDGQPTQAAQWFVDNYRANPQGDRAADSLIFLAESMVRLHDTNRACIALGQFAANFKTEADGRLRSDYEKTRSAVTCPAS